MTGDRVRMGRRAILLGLTAALTTPRSGAAQSSGRRPNVSLYTTDPGYRDAVKGVLQERGWVEGRTISFELYPTEGAEEATSTIPILGMDLESDPVSSGFVKTLARPGGNVSGIWMDVPEISGKQIQFLREILPGLSRLGVIWDDRVGQLQFAAVQTASRSLGISLQAGVLRLAAEVDAVMKRLLAERPQAILLLTAPVVFRVLPRIAELARENRLPSISPFSVYPSAGGLLAYGPDFPAMWRQLANYVDRVLRGAKIGDLPVERPTKFTLVVNLKTARALGLTLPQPLVLRADEVIQ